MIKLKKILKESKYAWDRKFGDPLPTFKDIAETHQNKPIKEMTSKTKRDMENSFETSEDLDDFITKHQSEIPKNQWRKIDNYLDDIRDEEQGMKSSGWADPAKKGLKKILTKYIKESVNEGPTPNDLMKELEKVNEIVIKILKKYEESMPPNYIPRVIQKWMMSLHQDIKKQGYRV